MGHVDGNLIRVTALTIGLVDVKVAAVTDGWSGSKLAWRLENRGNPWPAA